MRTMVRALLAVAGLTVLGTMVIDANDVATPPATVMPQTKEAFAQPVMPIIDRDSIAALTLGAINYADSISTISLTTVVTAPDAGIISAAIIELNAATTLWSDAAPTPVPTLLATKIKPITKKIYGLTGNEVLRVDGKADVKSANYLAKERGTPATLDAYTVVDPLIQAGVLSA